MTLDQSALSELLDAIRAGGNLDVVRAAVATMLQALISLEATLGDRCRPLRAQRIAGDAPQRRAASHFVDQGR